MKKSNILIVLVSVILYSIIVSPAYSQDTVKIMSYNLLNYNVSTVKDQSFRKIMQYSSPDILVCEEVISQVAVDNMLTNVMNYYTPGLYTAGTFINGFDTDNAVYFKTSKFTFLYNFAIQTTLRTINLFGLVHNQSGETIKLFAVHLKASSGTANEQQRLSEVNVLREFTNSLPNGNDFIVLGDFNFYTSTEPAYQRLLQIDAGSEGYFIDPYTLSGTWNQSSYAPYHTQSTRTRSLSDSGASGGLDDRFDMLLNSRAVMDEGGIKYIPGSLKALGNDGNHYNDSINKQPNTAVPDSIANALYYGSDHLPVYALYKFQSTISINNISGNIPESFKIHQNYPNPFNPVTKIKFDIPAGVGVTTDVKLVVYNSLGTEVSTLVNQKISPGSYEVDFKADHLSSGVYFYKLITDKFTQTKSMILLK